MLDEYCKGAQNPDKCLMNNVNKQVLQSVWCYMFRGSCTSMLC